LHESTTTHPYDNTLFQKRQEKNTSDSKKFQKKLISSNSIIFPTLLYSYYAALSVPNYARIKKFPCVKKKHQNFPEILHNFKEKFFALNLFTIGNHL